MNDTARNHVLRLIESEGLLDTLYDQQRVTHAQLDVVPIGYVAVVTVKLQRVPTFDELISLQELATV